MSQSHLSSYSLKKTATHLRKLTVKKSKGIYLCAFVDALCVGFEHSLFASSLVSSSLSLKLIALLR